MKGKDAMIFKKANLFLIIILFALFMVGCDNNTDGLTKEEREVLLNDKVPPVITIEEGYELLTFDAGEEVDIFLGIKGEDNLQGDLTDKITVIDDGFDVNKKGSYEIHYFLADYAGNNAEIVKRTIRVLDRENVNLIAHRGFSAKEYDNTIDAYQKAVEAKFWGMETDVRVTADNKLVLAHDDAIYPATGKTGSISKMTFDEVMELEFSVAKFPGKTYKYASFHDYLMLAKESGVTPVIELKAPFTYEQIQLVLDMVEEENMMDKVVFISFDLPYLQYIRNRHSDVPLQLLIGTSHVETQLNTCIEKKISVSVAFTHPTFFTIEMIDRFHNAGLNVAAWTVDNPDKMIELINLGVDYFTSNALDKIPEYK